MPGAGAGCCRRGVCFRARRPSQACTGRCAGRTLSGRQGFCAATSTARAAALTCRLSSDQSLLENSGGESASCVSVFFLVSASRHRRRAPSVIRASTELRHLIELREVVARLGMRAARWHMDAGQVEGNPRPGSSHFWAQSRGAYALPVNASCPGSPQAHASLGSGWRPDGVGYLYGFKQGSKITSWHLVLLDRASPGTRVVARIEIEPPRSQLAVVHRPAA